MLTLANLAKGYGTRTLFEDVSLFIKRDDRLGLVGPNGAGKSTLFKLILGEDSPDAGEVTWERGSHYGFLPQESTPVGDATVLEIATGGLAHDIASTDPNNPDHLQKLAEIDYSREPRAKKILTGLGFREGEWERPARTFSGGWVMRAHLARLLVEEPDLLLLDEPTNHLDLAALLWFQDYLVNYRGGIIVISHDRAFLNALCNGILEIRHERLYRWTGNYDDYLVQKDAHAAQLEALAKNQQREIAHLQKFVDRFGAKATLASRAKSKEKQIARLQAVAIDAPQGDGPIVSRFRFPQPERTGQRVLELKGVKQAYGEKVIYDGLACTIERGEKLVLIGPNGAGKSTLLKILAGNLPLLAGERLPGLRAKIGYFAQNRLETLEPENTVFAEALRARAENPAVTEQMARDLLGAFLFRGDAIDKKVAVLSGGEKSRLSLVKLLLAPPNLLLMDEPTTHLDIPSIDALIAALQAYEGSLVFISHDVHFIRAVARKVIHVEAGQLTPYAGDYDYFLEKSGASDARAALESSQAGNSEETAKGSESNTSPAPGTLAGGYKTKEQKRAEAEARAAKGRLRKEVETLEGKIAELEKQQQKLNEQLADPEVYADHALFRRLQDELHSCIEALERITAKWEEKALQLEEDD
jgi:ATP-binding cassette subfamily F protein 3